MLLETEKEQICINQLIEKKKEIFTIDNDIIVNDVKPDVLRIISTNGNVCIQKQEVKEGKLILEGMIRTDITYLSDSENSDICTLNSNNEFKVHIDLKTDNEACLVIPNIRIKSFDSKIINGRKINVKTYLEVDFKIYENNNMEIIKDIDEIEGMEVLKKKEKLLSLIGTGSSRVQAKDTVELSDDFAGVMKMKVDVIDIEGKSSYNKVLIKADIYIDITYLTADNKINIARAKIPVMGFVDMQNTSENNIYNINYIIKNIIVKPNVEEDKLINVEVEVEFFLQAYEEKEIDIVEDLYSICSKVNFSNREIETTVHKSKITDICTIDQEVPMNREDNTIVLDVIVVPEILKTDILTNQIIYEGEMNVETILREGLNVSNNISKVPFRFEINSNKVIKGADISTDIRIVNNSYNIDKDHISLNTQIEFIVSIDESKELNIINSIEMEDLMEKDPYSMVIYFVKPGDTLWKIAKKFNSRVNDIADINNIKEKEKISIGKQLYIPKAVKSSV